MTRRSAWGQFCHTIRLGMRMPLPLDPCQAVKVDAPIEAELRENIARLEAELDRYRDVWRYQCVALEVISVQSTEPDVAGLAHGALEYWPGANLESQR